MGEGKRGGAKTTGSGGCGELAGEKVRTEQGASWERSKRMPLSYLAPVLLPSSSPFTCMHGW